MYNKEGTILYKNITSCLSTRGSVGCWWDTKRQRDEGIWRLLSLTPYCYSIFRTFLVCHFSGFPNLPESLLIFLSSSQFRCFISVVPLFILLHRCDILLRNPQLICCQKSICNTTITNWLYIWVNANNKQVYSNGWKEPWSRKTLKKNYHHQRWTDNVRTNDVKN